MCDVQHYSCIFPGITPVQTTTAAPGKFKVYVHAGDQSGIGHDLHKHPPAFSFLSLTTHVYLFPLFFLLSHDSLNSILNLSILFFLLCHCHDSLNSILNLSILFFLLSHDSLNSILNLSILFFLLCHDSLNSILNLSILFFLLCHDSLNSILNLSILFFLLCHDSLNSILNMSILS